MGDYVAKYSNYNDFNRLQNLDGIEAKIVMHLINSDSKYAQNFWRILKYNDLNALSQPHLTKAEKLELISNDNGESTKKRLFFAPFVDDAWQEQCSSVYIYVNNIDYSNHLEATVSVAVETVVHSKISTVVGDGDDVLNPNKTDEFGNVITYGANPNDSDKEGNIVVAFKNRATVLLKCLLAELNGLYLDGVGYLQLNKTIGGGGLSSTKLSLWNSRSFYGHHTDFVMKISGVSSSGMVGF